MRVRKLLTVSMDVSLAHFNLDLSWYVVAVLLRCPLANYICCTVTIILGRFDSFTIKFNGVGACYVIDNLLLHVAVRSFDVDALIIVLSRGINFESCVAYTILPCKASLNLVSFFQSFVVYGFDQVADKFVHIEADTINFCLDYACTIFVHSRLTVFLVLSPTSLLSVRLTLILKHHFLLHMAVRFRVRIVTINISLTDLRIILRLCSRTRIIRRRFNRRHWNISALNNIQPEDEDG